MYRSDHEAALARIAALEADNRRLTAEVAELRATEVPGVPRAAHARTVLIVAAVVVSALSIVFGAVLAVRAAHDSNRGEPAPAATCRPR